MEARCSSRIGGGIHVSSYYMALVVGQRRGRRIKQKLLGSEQLGFQLQALRYQYMCECRDALVAREKTSTCCKLSIDLKPNSLLRGKDSCPCCCVDRCMEGSRLLLLFAYFLLVSFWSLSLFWIHAHSPPRVVALAARASSSNSLKKVECLRHAYSIPR